MTVTFEVDPKIYIPISYKIFIANIHLTNKLVYSIIVTNL